MKVKIKPINSYVLVKPIVREEMTKSGIFLPETADKERPEKGEVIAVGEGRVLENGKKMPMVVKVGDMVVFKKYTPDEIKIEGVEYLVIKDENIIAIIEK